MAHDWLGDLFRRWGRTPARRTTRRHFTVERLEARDVPAVDPLFAILNDPTPQVAVFGTDPFRPGPELTASPTEVFVSVTGADPTAVLAGLLADPSRPALNLSRVEPFLINGSEGLFQVGLAAGTTPAEAIGWFGGRAGVQWASPNYFTQTDPRLFTPNDPLFKQQYHLQTIQAEKAWDVTTGDPRVIIAITDDGVLDNHPDFGPNMWVNPSPTNGDKFGITAFVDPASSKYGFTRPVAGDFHGNHVAGIAAARTDNATGVAGVAGGKAGSPGAQVMAIRTYGPDLGRGLYGSSIAKSMIYATDNGAKVVNSSFVTSNFVDAAGAVDPVLRAAFDYMYGKGVLHLIAAGNDNSSNTANMQYTHGLIVSSTDQSDLKSDFSNYGDGVDISAPGTDILATWANGAGGVNEDYFAISGTSMATPVVAGVAALIWSAHLTWTRDQVVAQLLGSADSAAFYANNPSFTDKLGSGRVNAFRGVSETLPAPRFGATPGLPAEGKTVSGLSTFTLRTPLRLAPADVQTTDYELRGAGTDGQFATADDILVPLTVNNGQAYRIGSNGLTFTFPALGPGQFRFTAFAAKITDPFGKILDGNGDGTAGGDFVRTFTAAPTVSGTVFEDFNATGVADTNDVGAGGMTVFLDKNGNSKRDAGEFFTFAGLGGRYSFPTAQFQSVPAGSYTVRVEVPTGWAATAGGQSYPVTVAKGSTAAGLNFGLARVGAVYGTAFNDADGNGLRAAGDPGVPGFTVFLDADADGKYTVPTATGLSKGSNPNQVDVPDNGTAGSPITITSAAGKISKVALTVTADSGLDTGGGIQPGFLFNLTLTLVGPDGTRVPLAGYLDNAFSMVNTVLDSTAATSVRTGGGTLTGTFRPTGDLSVFNGLSPLGTWVLEGLDNQLNGPEPFFTSVSVIRNWSLALTTTDGDQQIVTGGTGGYRFDTIAGKYGLNLVRQAGFALTAPQTGYGLSVDTTAGAVPPTSFGLRRDTTAPRLLSLTPTGPVITNSKTLTYVARFSEAIEGLTLANFDLSAVNLTGAKIESLTATAIPGVYTLVVSEPGGFGTVAVSLPAAASKLTDFALNPLVGAPANADLVTVDTLPPTSSLTLPPSPGGKNVYTSATWAGQLTGAAADAQTGVSDVFVTVRQDATGLYFDGTSFSSSDPVPVTAKLNTVTNAWSLPLSAGVLPEGPYTVTQAAVDFATNVQTVVNTATFGIDNGPPTVGITPAGGSLVNTNPVPFLLSFSEPVSGDIAAGLTVTGGTLIGVTGSLATYTASVRPNGSGPVSIRLAAGTTTDFAGNPSGAATGTITFDGTAPTVSLPAGEDGQAVTSANFAGVLVGTAGDDLSGVARVQVAVRRRVNGTDVYFDGTGFTAAAPVYATATGTAAWSYGFPAASFPADDVYQFLVRATDLAGNPTVVPVNVTIDNAAPVPAVVAPAAGALVNAATFEAAGKRVSGTAADATSGPVRTEVSVWRVGTNFYWNGSDFVPSSATPLFVPAGGTATNWTLPTLTADRLTDGQYQVVARTVDRAGNEGTTSATFTFDNTAPVPVGLRPTNGIGYNAAGWPNSLSGGVADSGDTAGVQVSIRRDADGTYWNGSFFGSTSPLLLQAAVSQPTPLGGPPIPGLPPVPGTSFSYPFSAFGFPTEGLYTLTVVATDKAGSQGTAVSNFSFDNSSPTSTIATAGSAAVFSPATFPGRLTGTAADTLSGVGLVQVSLRQVATGRYFDGAGFTSTSEQKLAATLTTPNGKGTGWVFGVAASALPADGQYLVNTYATDVAGNVQAFGTPYTFGFDATAPQAVVQADKGAVTNVAPLSFTVGFTSAVGDLDPTGLAVTNGTVLDVTRKSDSTFVVRVTPAADGAVGLTVLATAAKDAAGNPTLPAGPAVGQFDRTPPTVTLTAPAGVLPLGDAVTVTATFSEPVVGFGAASLVPTNATVLGVSGSGASYSIQLLPSGPGAVGLSIVSGAFADPAGNLGTAAVGISRTSEDPRYAVAVGNVVRAYDVKNGVRGQTAPFGDAYTGTVRVASADFNGDGIPDIVAGTGPGGATNVVVLDGKSFAPLFQINPFEDGFTGGVFVAAGDLTGDGVADLVITPDEGGGPRVRVFDGKSFGQVADFFGIADSAFRGGARAAVGDVNGDGVGDLIVAAGFGGGPRVAVFDGTTISKGEGNLQRVVSDFFAYEQTLRNGVYVSAGDLDGDGVAELVTSAGPGGGPRVTAFSGSELTAGRLTRTVDFFAGDPETRDGVRVAVKRMATNAPAELVVGGGATNRLAVYTADGLRQSPPTPSFDQDLLPGVSGGGVFVG